MVNNSNNKHTNNIHLEDFREDPILLSMLLLLLLLAYTNFQFSV